MIGAQFPSLNSNVASLLARGPYAPNIGIDESGALSVPGATTQPFTWGAGGVRLSAEDLARRRAFAEKQMAGDYSPVQHWLQGAARVAENFAGALEMRDIRKDERERADTNQAIIDALLRPPEAGTAAASPGTSNEAVIAALLSDDPRVSKVGQLAWERDNRKPVQPHYWETNDGSLGMIGADGKPQIVYQDRTPKITWIQAENADGTKTLIPVGPNGPIAGTSAAQPTAPSARPPSNTGAGDNGFVDYDGASRMLQSMALPQFLAWQQQHGTPIEVVSEQQFRSLPSGVQYVGPDGVKRIK